MSLHSVFDCYRWRVHFKGALLFLKTLSHRRIQVKVHILLALIYTRKTKKPLSLKMGLKYPWV